MDLFARFPEECISEILSLTTPLDTIRSSSVSKGFRSAADSDSIWERFLPSDYQEIISRSASPILCSNYTKRELFFVLCNSFFLIDEGRMSFSVDKRNGKKSYMLSSTELIISWTNKYSLYGEWKSHHNSRFSQVISLRSASWLDIGGRIETRKLSPGTLYAAYLVFNFIERPYGLECANSVIKFINSESDGEAENRASNIQLQSREFSHGDILENIPKSRPDGWMEVEMGSFYNDQGDKGEVELNLIEIKSPLGKHGLILEGIEFRPKCV